MNLAEKQELVQQLQERMQRANACVVAEYQGLTVADLTKLRRSLYPHEGEFKIAKNRLVRLLYKVAISSVFYRSICAAL